jgi:hypothetical protein
VDFRHLELQDILSEALIALEGGRPAAAMAAIRKALDWAEAEWLSTASDFVPRATTPSVLDDDDDD